MEEFARRVFAMAGISDDETLLLRVQPFTRADINCVRAYLDGFEAILPPE